MLGYKSFFPVFVRMISRSCVREKIQSLGSGQATKKDLKIGDKIVLPVEEDTEKLAKYVCGTNLFVEGGKDVELKDDSEYPDWLWEIRTPPPLSELSPKTKTYWNRIRKMREKERQHLLSFQKSKTLQK